MNVAKFLYNQIIALPEKDRQEFIALWEENKKQLKAKTNKKIKNPPPLCFEDYYKTAVDILTKRQKKLSSKSSS